ncbi:MAG TPA: M67 family metallopeptidase [Ktedonobacterales bacterium]|nr:M67 family metallopeptidase [Ktedonobacterales bacterium]
MVVTLPRPIYDAMVAHVRAGYPDEACGILAGDDATDTATKIFPARNAAEDPSDFSIIDGPELLDIWNEIDGNDWCVLSYFHSHPRSPAYPSPRDIQYAKNWPGTYYLIFTLMDDPDTPQLRAFLVDGDQVSEHEIAIVEA